MRNRVSPIFTESEIHSTNHGAVCRNSAKSWPSKILLLSQLEKAASDSYRVMLKDPKGCQLNEETWVTEGPGPMGAWEEEATDVLWVFWLGSETR